MEGDCAVEVGEEDAFGLVFEGLWERHDGGVEEVVLQQCRAGCLPSTKGVKEMRNVVQKGFEMAACRGFVEAHIQKSLLVGEGSARSEHVFFRPPSPPSGWKKPTWSRYSPSSKPIAIVSIVNPWR